MTKPLIQTPKGFRDLLPEQMVVKNHLVSLFRRVFETFGFSPLETPTLEYADILLGKYGPEADKLLYTFTDRGGRSLGLNYDLTVPTARVLSQYRDIQKPFKRYQIQPAYRAENPQKGRYRQFTQCDFDIIGSSSPLADAEILAVISQSLLDLKLPGFTININSRPVLYSLMSELKIAKDRWPEVLRVVDKLDKSTPEDLDAELVAKGSPARFFSTVILPRLNEVEAAYQDNQKTSDPYLNEVISLALSLGVDAAHLKFTPSIVRGLDYYTGPIFETVVSSPKIGSVTGGGRYDHLIAALGGPDLPAVGSTIGLDRLIDVITELNLLPELSPAPKILITIFSPELLSASLKTVSSLRQLGISAEIFLDSSAPIDKQLKYADRRGISFSLLLGPSEVDSGNVTIKNMKTGDQKTVPLSAVADLI